MASSKNDFNIKLIDTEDDNSSSSSSNLSDDFDIKAPFGNSETLF